MSIVILINYLIDIGSIRTMVTTVDISCMCCNFFIESDLVLTQISC